MPEDSRRSGARTHGVSQSFTTQKARSRATREEASVNPCSSSLRLRRARTHNRPGAAGAQLALRPSVNEHKEQKKKKKKEKTVGNNQSTDLPHAVSRLGRRAMRTRARCFAAFVLF